MRVSVNSKDSGFDFETELHCSIDLPNELNNNNGLCNFIHDQLTDVLQDCLRDDLWDMYSKILNDCPSKPIGFFEKKQTYEFFCNHAKDVIEANRVLWTVECSVFDNTVNPIAKFDLELSDILLDMLNEESNTGEFDARLSSYVESCLQLFVEKSSWHIEDERVWFGIDGQIPLSAWSIHFNKSKDLSIWFESDAWTIMSTIGDFDDCFLIWYTAECGCWVPDMNEIRKSCPILFDDSDSVKSLFEKVKVYLMQRSI